MTHRARLVALIVAGIAAVGACTAGPGGAPTPSLSTLARSEVPSPTPVPVPDPSAGSGSAGGGSSGNPGTGIIDPAPPGIGGNPGDPKPAFVTPVAGAKDVHPIIATGLRAAANGRKVAAQVSWYGGVEPCSVLASVDVTRDGRTITLTVNEGSVAAPDTMCIEIAMLKATVVDLGELDPGTWTIVAHDAPPVEVVVQG
jgi:hypothetical protein